MKNLIYSVVAYKLNEQTGETKAWLKEPCTSQKAAFEYKKVLQNWWPKTIVTIEWDEPVNCKKAKELAELPF